MEKNKTIAIIGGSQERLFIKQGEMLGVNVLFHDGKSIKGSPKKQFASIISRADCVVLLRDACNHCTMDAVKIICKKRNKKICYPRGRGITGTLNAALEAL